MKVTILYLHVVKSGYPGAAPPEYYKPFSHRWAATYKLYKPRIEHDVKIVCCGDDMPDEMVNPFYGQIASGRITYTGAGSDIGACQYAMQQVDSDFVLCMSTPVYFWRTGWLERIVEARQFFGDGLYGPMASNQNRPHIRTSCWGVDPKTFAQYPHLIDNREKCSWAESFDHDNEGWQISDWYRNQGKPAMLVTWDGVWAKQDWRKPNNIFRRGDQSNCPVWDQHVDVYFVSHYHERLALEKLADEDCTAIPSNPEKV